MPLHHPNAALRPVRPCDVAPLAGVHANSWRLAYAGLVPSAQLQRAEVSTTELWMKLFAESNPRVVPLAYDADGLGGFVVAGPNRTDHVRADGEIRALFLSPGVVGLGRGRTLFLAGCSALAQQGHRTLAVRCLEGNARARRFYERMGGTLVPYARRHVLFLDQALPELTYLWREIPQAGFTLPPDVAIPVSSP